MKRTMLTLLSLLSILFAACSQTGNPPVTPEPEPTVIKDIPVILATLEGEQLYKLYEFEKRDLYAPFQNYLKDANVPRDPYQKEMVTTYQYGFLSYWNQGLKPGHEVIMTAIMNGVNPYHSAYDQSKVIAPYNFCINKACSKTGESFKEWLPLYNERDEILPADEWQLGNENLSLLLAKEDGKEFTGLLARDNIKMQVLNANYCGNGNCYNDGQTAAYLNAFRYAIGETVSTPDGKTLNNPVTPDLIWLHDQPFLDHATLQPLINKAKEKGILVILRPTPAFMHDFVPQINNAVTDFYVGFNQTIEQSDVADYFGSNKPTHLASAYNGLLPAPYKYKYTGFGPISGGFETPAIYAIYKSHHYNKSWDDITQDLKDSSYYDEKLEPYNVGVLRIDRAFAMNPVGSYHVTIKEGNKTVYDSDFSLGIEGWTKPDLILKTGIKYEISAGSGKLNFNGYLTFSGNESVGVISLRF